MFIGVKRVSDYYIMKYSLENLFNTLIVLKTKALNGIKKIEMVSYQDCFNQLGFFIYDANCKITKFSDIFAMLAEVTHV